MRSDFGANGRVDTNCPSGPPYPRHVPRTLKPVAEVHSATSFSDLKFRMSSSLLPAIVSDSALGGEEEAEKSAIIESGVAQVKNEGHESRIRA